jgi:glycosyltransferase involved in cell wall biosynthesis
MRKISVIIPAFNCAATVRKSVLSVLEDNTTAVAELILVDDKSTDETLSIIRELEKKYSIVKVICHDINLGGAAARNTAIKNCNEKYIFCLDSDNILLPGSLSKLVDFAESRDADVAAFKELHYFANKTTNVTHLWRYPEGHFTFADYLAGTVVPGASGNYLFKKSAWAEVGGYRSGSGALDSWVFGLDLVANGKRMYVAPDGFYLHRYGILSYWVRESSNQKAGILATKLIDKYLDQIDEDSQHWIKNSDGDWFEKIDLKPLKLKNLNVGQAGTVVYKAFAMRLRNTFFRILSMFQYRKPI